MEDIPWWQTLEEHLRTLTTQYNYKELRFPNLEQTSLFKRLGQDCDIGKEMYTFEDKNGDLLTLRPEGTASAVRAALNLGLLHNQIQQCWYMGPMFRHERPQKGRYRQFHQFGVELFGLANASIEAELLAFCNALWLKCGLDDVTLELNHLGGEESRSQHQAALKTYLLQHQDKLDEDSQRRLLTNPLRIFDSKNASTQDILSDAPTIHDFLNDSERKHLDELKRHLDSLNINYIINPGLVRGLDYYTGIVFEWTTTSLGAQNTICAGGRYDELVSEIGGKPTPAFGMAIGLERLILCMQTLSEDVTAEHKPTSVYLIAEDVESASTTLKLAQSLRHHFSTWTIQCDHQAHAPKNAFKRAIKSGANLSIQLSMTEGAEPTLVIKHLDTKGEPKHINLIECIDYLRAIQTDHPITHLT